MTQDRIAMDAIVNGLPLPAISIAADGRINAMNDLAHELWDGDRLGMHYITALRQPTILEAIEATDADGQSRTARFTGRAGARDTTWNVKVASLGQEHGILLSFVDTTALQDAEQMRRDFVANVSHELRTPLTALLGFIETLRGAARDDAVARERFLSIMEQEAGRMASLVEDLLSLSRVEEEERVRPVSPVDLVALIHDAQQALQGVAARAGITLNVDMPVSTLQVPGDAGQLRQVISNLVENAIKYGQNGKKVQIILTPESDESALRGSGVRLIVRDFGDGIAPHHIARLTERFYRIDTHRSREVGGTGLGLAIVKHIVNRHRGRFRIESELGEGSTFTVILPTT